MRTSATDSGVHLKRLFIAGGVIALCAVAAMWPGNEPWLQAASAGDGEDRLKSAFAAIMSPSSHDKSFQAVTELHKFVLEKDGNGATLVRRAAEYLSSDEGRSPGGLGLVIALAGLPISPHEKVAALAPMLDAEGEEVPEMTAFMLSLVDLRDQVAMPNYEYYETYLHEHEPARASGLVRYMYLHAPGEAVKTLAAVELSEPAARAEFRDVLWLECVVSHAARVQTLKFSDRDEGASLKAARIELEKMARNRHWWVRLYVATIMSKHASLRDEKVWDTLRKDENELIRQVVSIQ